MSWQQWAIVLSSLVIAQCSVGFVLPAGDFIARGLYVAMWASFGAVLAMGIGDDY